ncbi:MAG: L,D-transpeptidase family protein [Gammaproteobacteria bacterium]|uniref:L,D-transpeptidase family protein n=1 Tax=Rhodoferax sp. TaxID=50421 RepID=UPI0017FB10BA|nr:L,D-transpeptidase family protein [Rhodoferax sp.]MBA3058769.1 L,D-transpeptidase family protein [Rhodoferax sp.]MBU3899241.1 L,D-transpeptidase family protein [Gammaproteobacteria bacterium]MBU4082041.1 L,D-transpeptidase family protein [Gammaproteobacteria bacterium]MBU4172748.1 L,D-transpeptidase family protein [Gammaproteobacteria bacterium]
MSFKKINGSLGVLALIVLWGFHVDYSIGATLELKPKSKIKSKEGSRARGLGDGVAEARLIEIYRMIGSSNIRDALPKAENLVADYPNFQLAQLVYGDLLAARSRPIQSIGDVPPEIAKNGLQNLLDLRAESQLRLSAIKQVPPSEAIPSQFVSLSRRNKHAIAVDTEKARLYLFENTVTGTRLLANYYISVGKAGVGKTVEGDQRTPLGVYFITSNLDPKSLKDLYGSGALPVNYPNVLDLRRGKTGSGIWLHGTPSSQFTRAPQATDGCVAVANPDLVRIIRTVEIRTTPVLIGKNLNWVRPDKLAGQKKQFSEILQTWTNAKRKGRENELLQFYANDFSAEGKDLKSFGLSLRAELNKTGNKPVSLKDISLIRWTDEAETMVATFGEVLDGEKVGRTVRQYWQHRPGGWKIIYEGLV